MKKLFLTLCLSIIIFANLANAKEIDKISIVATVADEAITNADLLNRLKITILSSGLQGDPKTVAKLQPKALQDLIDEKMFIAEAKKAQYTISEKEVDEAIQTLEKQNNMRPGDLMKLMKANGVPKSALHDKLRGEIAFAYLVARNVRNKVSVSDEEVADYLKAQSQVVTHDEYFLNEIVIPVDLPSDAEKALSQIRTLKDKIVNGESFAEVAKKGSASPSAANGGAVGWLAEAQIPQEIMQVVKQRGIGQVAGPIRSIEGYYLVLISDKRTVSSAAENDIVSLKQFFALPKKKEDVQLIAKKLLGLESVTEACLRPDTYAKNNGLNLVDFGKLKISGLAQPVKAIVKPLQTGKFSQISDQPNGMSRFIVCERSQGQESEPTETEKETAQEFLESKKIELEAGKYLRNLRLKTNIDVRI